MPLGLEFLYVSVLIIALAVWWWVPKWQATQFKKRIRDPKALADIEDSWRKSFSQLLGGAAVLIGACLAYHQTQMTLQASHEQLLSQQKSSNEQIKAAREQLISQHVSKGFEQLGSNNLSVRLGGIYALEGVMNTSEQYHKPVLEALCAFVRDGTKGERLAASSAQGKSGKSDLLGTDIQAALTVIGRRAANDLDSVNLVEANLSTADLIGINFSGADMRDISLVNADLTKSNLSGTNLFKAKLIGANLYNANLSGAKLSWADASKTILSRANLSGANLFMTNFSGARLSDTSFRGAKLLKADLSGANLSGADLIESSITQDQLNAACGDSATRLPQGFSIKQC